jgi:hypothetical protein
MLGFGPTAQQAISIDLRPIKSTTPAANINRAVQYHPVKLPEQGLAGLDNIIPGTVVPGKSMSCS